MSDVTDLYLKLSSFENGHTLPLAAQIAVVAAKVYDCESVTSSARDKTHEGMLPVIRPDRSKWDIFPVFRRLHANSASTVRRFPIHSVCISIIALSYELHAAAARQFEVEDLARFYRRGSYLAP